MQMHHTVAHLEGGGVRGFLDISQVCYLLPLVITELTISTILLISFTATAGWAYLFGMCEYTVPFRVRISETSEGPSQVGVASAKLYLHPLQAENRTPTCTHGTSKTGRHFFRRHHCYTFSTVEQVTDLQTHKSDFRYRRLHS